jgi:hypothetical protein
MELLDYISEQPIEVISNIELLPDRVTFPKDIDSEEFYTIFTTSIKNAALSYEKALYVANREKSTESTTLRKMLLQRAYRQ